MSLVSTFGAITKNFKLKPQQYVIDNLAFRLHYKATVLFFLVGTILVTSRQYIGEHIRCIADGGVPEHVMNTFCFFTTTFTVPGKGTKEDLEKIAVQIKDLDAKLLDSGNLAHPGVGPYDFSEPIKRHAYYQWVPFVLFGQGLMFYLTHMLWKKLEGGRLRNLVDGLRYAAFSLDNEKELKIKDSKIPSKTEKKRKIEEIRQLFVQGIYINKNWSRSLIVCEILNLLHVILQIYITNKFLSGNFKNLGYNVWTQGLDSSVDILDEVFPKITKCTFHKYGPSGSIQLHDAMCVMALNIINDKIYTALWFWFVFLLVVSIGALLWRAATIALHAKSSAFNKMVFAASCPGRLNPWNSLMVSKQRNFSDWMFLVYLAKNLDPMVMKEIFTEIADGLDESHAVDEKEPLVNLS